MYTSNLYNINIGADRKVSVRPVSVICQLLSQGVTDILDLRQNSKLLTIKNGLVHIIRHYRSDQLFFDFIRGRARV